MRFKGLDLNLLSAFDTLLETRNVSRAAEMMNLSQPAMSAALGRLRDYFHDDILVPQGKRMYPTPYAESLLPRVRECLRGVEALIATSTVFDPATSQRVFKLIASDYTAAAVVVPLIASLAETAPFVRIEILLPHDQSQQMIEQGKVDLMITPEDYISRNQPAELLFEERHLIAGWSGNPLFQRQITEEDVFAAGHVGVAVGNLRTPAFSDTQLEMMGKQRRVEVMAASFTMVPWLLKDTMRLALMHERLVRKMGQFFPLASAPIPFPFPVMREMLQYHSARASDDGLCWLRAKLRETAHTDPISFADRSSSKQ